MNTDIKKEAFKITQKTFEGKLHPLVGCRRLIQLKVPLGMEEDKDFLALTGIESETDHIMLIPDDASPYMYTTSKNYLIYSEDLESEIRILCENINKSLQKMENQ